MLTEYWKHVTLYSFAFSTKKEMWIKLDIFGNHKGGVEYMYIKHQQKITSAFSL